VAQRSAKGEDVPVSLQASWTSLFEREALLLLGLVDLGEEAEFPRFRSWLSESRHGDMRFLEQHQHLRADPRGLLPEAKQALVFALPYFQGDQLLAARRGAYRVAQYARLKDYHRSMRERGTRVLRSLQELYPGLQGRVTIDSAPLLERALASRTRRGFIGKNTLYIHPDHGSFLLLGELLLNQRLDFADEPASIKHAERSPEGGCGTCRRCQVHCPTGALDQDYRIDARKCIAYWTIEHRGPVPFEFWPWFRLYLFGCDLCQLACPYNRRALPTSEATRTDFATLDLFDVATMNQQRYEQLFGGTPLTRAKRAGLRRNALIAMSVSEDPRLEMAMASVEADDPEVLQDTRNQIKQWQSRQPCQI
jgi:epoxyqueuosine reductase